MDAPLSGTSQGYGAGDVPNTTNILAGSSSFEDHYDPNLDCLLNCCFGEDCSYSVNDLFNEPSEFVSKASSFYQNESRNVSNYASKVQPRVYNRSPSLILNYTPPPSAMVVELQCLPAQPFPADVSAPIIVPPHSIATPAVVPCHPLPADVVPCDIPSRFLHPHVASNVSVPNMPPHPHFSMPPQRQPFVYNTHQVDDSMCCTGSQSHDPHHNFSFGFSDVEAKHKSQLPFDLFHDGSKLTVSMNHQNPIKLELPKLEVPTSPIPCVSIGTASPAYMQSNNFSMADNSHSPTVDMSSASAPAAQATSNSSLYWTSTPLE